MNPIQSKLQIPTQVPAEPEINRDLSSFVKPEKDRGNSLEFINGARETKDFERALNHSKRVGLLKYALPASAMAIIALIIAALVLRPELPADISIGKTGIEDGKLVMQNPKLNGLDDQGRKFSLNASRAVQSVENPTQVELEKIVAKLPMEGGIFANIKAGNGSYDASEKNLELGGGVEITTSNGMVMKLQDAYVDLKKGTMNTDRQIEFTSETAKITSQSLKVLENGDSIIFDTNVRLTIQPPKKKDK